MSSHNSFFVPSRAGTPLPLPRFLNKGPCGWSNTTARLRPASESRPRLDFVVWDVSCGAGEFVIRHFKLTELMLPRSIVEEDLPTVPLAKGRPSAAPTESSRHAKGHLGAVRSSLFCSKGLPIVSFQNSAQKHENWIFDNYRSIVHPVSLLLLFSPTRCTDRQKPPLVRRVLAGPCGGL